MTPNLRTIGRLALVLALVAIAAGTRLARAQDDDFDENENGQPPPAPAGRAVVIQPAINLDQMDQWVFNRFGGSAGARTKLDSALMVRIDDLERSCGLTEAQKKKLRLAGRGDIKRFFDRLDELKRKIQQGQHNPNVNVWQEFQPFQVEVTAGLFDNDSIYAKTLKRTLSDEQAARFESLSRERKLVRHRATVDWFVVHLGKSLGLTDDQRRRFVDLLVTETRPPKKFGHGDYWYLMSQTARLPEAKIKPVFDAPQWRLLSRQFIQARQMERSLKINGVVPDEEREADKAAIRGARALQISKLRLAGRGDIKRFLDRIDDIMVSLDDFRGDLLELELVEIEMQSARHAMSVGLFGEGSLFSKTLDSSALRYPLAVGRATETLERDLGLNVRQRIELADLIVRETRPPLKYGKASDIALVLFEASKIPESKLRPILSEAQRGGLSRWIITYQEGAGNEGVLKRHGFVFDDTPVLTHHVPAASVRGEHRPQAIDRNKRD